MTLDQQRAVVHTNPNDPDKLRGLIGSGLITLTATATDGVGDHAAASLDSATLLFQGYGLDGNSIVDFAHNATRVERSSKKSRGPTASPYTRSTASRPPPINGDGTRRRLHDNNNTVYLFQRYQ